ncbi:DctP family TRAP transporter solute-binding subunit [Elioraea rosea]|uniref:DctP family TRAP transporter solute-binding subunit n=1 Tax=Elioraea rosea TaxID=2492390 RepID=UPI001182471C|nr:DctP family TRAP transporter solute-binding subunit [Elioraea rosea]
MTTISRRDALILAGAAGAATLAAPSIVRAQAARTIRYTHFQPGRLDQPKHAAALAFKAHVEAATGGRTKVEIFPAGQLGNANSVMEQLRLGSLEMAVVHDGGISPLFKTFGVFALPFAFDDQSVAWAVLDGAYGREVAEAMRSEVQIRLMAYADNGVRHFTNSKRALNTPEDLRGLKIRVQPAPVFLRLVEAFGASPSAIDWAELPAALAQGTVDGQENGVTNILAASLYQTQKFITLNGHVYSLHAYLMSDRFWGRLSAEEKLAVSQGIEIAKWIHRGMTTAQDANAETILKEKGMQVTALTPQQREAWRRVAQPPVRTYLEGEVGKPWVDKLLAAVEQAKAAQRAA